MNWFGQEVGVVKTMDEANTVHGCKAKTNSWV